MSIDEIKKLAEQPRQFTIESPEYVSLESLTQLMQTCLQPVIEIALDNKKTLKSSAIPTITVTPPNVEKINTMFKHCSALRSIETKSKAGELIAHENRVACDLPPDYVPMIS